MLTVDMLLKKAMKGELDLMGPAMKVANELMGIPDFGAPSDNEFERMHEVVGRFKKAVLMVAGAAAQKLAMSLAKEQEILMNIADMAIQLYAAESIVLRVEKLSKTKSAEELKVQMEIMRSFMYEASETINRAGREALMSFAEGDELRMMMLGMKRFTKMEPFNVKESRRVVAQAVIDANKYCF